MVQRGRFWETKIDECLETLGYKIHRVRDNLATAVPSADGPFAFLRHIKKKILVFIVIFSYGFFF